MALLGEQHPFIRTEYGLEELDDDGGLFGCSGARRSARRPCHGRQPSRHRDGLRLQIDVAGEEEMGWRARLCVGPTPGAIRPR